MRNLKKTYTGWALITGASSGIGKEFASELAKQGFNLVLVARSEDVLNQLSRDFQKKHNIKIRVITADLAQSGAAQHVFEQVADIDVSLLIPSAGVDEMGQFLEKDYSALQQMLRLNIEAPSELAHLFGRQMVARQKTQEKGKRSGIILVSSLFAYQGIPNFAAYAASKSYILTLGEALTVEMGKKGIDVLTLSPGLTATPFAAGLKMNLKLLPMIPQKPASVARVGLRNLGHKATVVSGFLNKFYAWENRLIPRSWPVALFGFLIGNAMKSYDKRQLKLNQPKKSRV